MALEVLGDGTEQIVIGMNHQNLARLGGGRPIVTTSGHVRPCGEPCDVWLLGGRTLADIRADLATIKDVRVPADARTDHDWLRFTLITGGARDRAVLVIGIAAACDLALRGGAELRYAPELRDVRLAALPAVRLIAGRDDDALAGRIVAGAGGVAPNVVAGPA